MTLFNHISSFYTLTLLKIDTKNFTIDEPKREKWSNKVDGYLGSIQQICKILLKYGN